MGRILEALMHGGKRGPVAGRPTLPPAAPADPAPPAPSEPADIPFIEVGGPGPIVEGSPEVLVAAGGAVRPRLPTATGMDGRGASAKPSPTARVLPAPGNPSGVAFQPANPPPSRTPAGQRFAPQLIAFHQPDHPVSEQYRRLLAGLTGQLRTEGPRVVAFLAPVSGTGTTTVLLNLAVTQAREGGRGVVVVDANLRRPAVAERLGLAASPGLREAAARWVPLTRALQPTGQPHCWALAAGEPLTAGSTWPSAEALRATLDELRGRFDWVLVDAPAWDNGTELLALGAACDAVFLVLRPGDLENPAVREIGRLLPPLGCGLGGYILTEH